MTQTPDINTQPLAEVDPEIAAALADELGRQRGTLEMIASENFVPRAILETQGSVLTNKYAEGYPGRRYYGGCEFVDVAENLAIQRAKDLFGAEHANVQPHAGAQANVAVMTALMDHGDTMMGLSLAHGGHLTHGMKINFSGKNYNATAYGVDETTMRIEMDQVREAALRERPSVIIAGWSAYPRQLDFERFREIADEVDAYIAPLVLGGGRSAVEGAGVATLADAEQAVETGDFGAAVQIAETLGEDDGDRVRRKISRMLARDVRRALRTGDRSRASSILARADSYPATSQIRSARASYRAAKARADALRARVAGGADFAEIARENSEDTSTRANGGDLGWFTQDEFGPDFGSQVAALSDGGVSQPFRTQAGWHIVQRMATRQSAGNDNNQRAQAREAIGQRKLEDEWDRYVRELRGEAYVSIRIGPNPDPEVVGSGG